LTRMQHAEVDDVAQTRAIGQVAGDAGEQECASAEHAIVVSRRAHEVIKNRDRGEQREYDEKPATKRTAFLQLSKCDAGVFGIDELKETGNDNAFVTEAQRSYGPRFRRLVSHVDAERRQQITGAPREPRAQISALVDARVHANLQKEQVRKRGLPPLSRLERAGANPDLFLSTALIIPRLASGFALQPHIRDGHAFFERLAHVVNSQRGH
jgi:hypothetical protein